MRLKNELLQKLSIHTTFDNQAQQFETYKPSAVLIPLIDNYIPKIILTKRTAMLPLHANQICFPGGLYHPQDKNFIQTALRETQEEIGLLTSQITPLGYFKHFFTLSGYYIVPIIGLITPPITYHLNTAEVATVIEAPLTYFLDLSRYKTMKVFNQKKLIEVCKITYQEHLIWGATAKILLEMAVQWHK
ncbi:MAG: hypothetical protein A3E87_04730 [Gammaproteobacteria bacterium RIFCSPHIGHO2_12_FULL_35_23]|nr:MAG: hypothetical protein A3E87_04730 [Gammaproteobacteria bacterium RIFCSPHIGHO2_12_FULL_35_23]